MKLRNKKTGEIVDTLCSDDITKGISFGIDHHDGNPTMAYYNSLAELTEEWEDVPEEPKVGYIIDPMEEDCVSADLFYSEHAIERAKELGIWFETKEEAEKAVEKLKAWKRLKDKGFKVDLWAYDGGNYIQKIQTGRILFRVKEYEENDKDLDLLFGGEE